MKNLDRTLEVIIGLALILVAIVLFSINYTVEEPAVTYLSLSIAVAIGLIGTKLIADNFLLTFVSDYDVDDMTEAEIDKALRTIEEEFDNVEQLNDRQRDLYEELGMSVLTMYNNFNTAEEILHKIDQTGCEIKKASTPDITDVAE